MKRFSVYCIRLCLLEKATFFAGFVLFVMYTIPTCSWCLLISSKFNFNMKEDIIRRLVPHILKYSITWLIIHVRHSAFRIGKIMKTNALKTWQFILFNNCLFTQYIPPSLVIIFLNNVYFKLQHTSCWCFHYSVIELFSNLIHCYLNKLSCIYIES